MIKVGVWKETKKEFRVDFLNNGKKTMSMIFSKPVTKEEIAVKLAKTFRISMKLVGDGKTGEVCKERKFYRTTYTFEVLSEEPIPDIGIDELVYQTIEGEYSGELDQLSTEEVDGATMAELLIRQGSDPGFFKIDKQGNDIDDDYADSEN